MIALERKRTERSGQPFVLLLLDGGDCLPSDRNGKVLGKILSALSLSTRETDVTGWYKNHSIVGVMFTDIGADERASILGTMMSRVSETLQSKTKQPVFVPIGELLQDAEQGRQLGVRSVVRLVDLYSCPN